MPVGLWVRFQGDTAWLVKSLLSPDGRAGSEAPAAVHAHISPPLAVPGIQVLRVTAVTDRLTRLHVRSPSIDLWDELPCFLKFRP